MVKGAGRARRQDLELGSPGASGLRTTLCTDAAQGPTCLPSAATGKARPPIPGGFVGFPLRSWDVQVPPKKQENHFRLSGLQKCSLLCRQHWFNKVCSWPCCLALPPYTRWHVSTVTGGQLRKRKPYLLSAVLCTERVTMGQLRSTFFRHTWGASGPESCGCRCGWGGIAGMPVGTSVCQGQQGTHSPGPCTPSWWGSPGYTAQPQG